MRLVAGHLAMELLKSMTGIDLAHIPYKGSAPALADLIAGRVDAMLDNTTSSLPQVRAGKLRARQGYPHFDYSYLAIAFGIANNTKLPRMIVTAKK